MAKASLALFSALLLGLSLSCHPMQPDKPIDPTIQVANYALDSSGNLYISGDFYRTVDFQPGSDSVQYSSTSSKQWDYFAAKYSPDNRLLWLRTWPSEQSSDPHASDYMHLWSMAVSPQGDVFLVGSFTGLCNLGPAKQQMWFDSASLGGQGAFLLKLNTNGEPDFIKVWGANTQCIKMLDSGDLLIEGTYRGAVDLDPGLGIHKCTSVEKQPPNSYTPGFQDTTGMFISRFSSDGRFIGAVDWPHDSLPPAEKMIIDDKGGYFLAGVLDKNNVSTAGIDVDPGPGVYLVNADTQNSLIIIKYKPDNTVGWVFQDTPDKPVESISSMVIADEGAIYLAASLVFHPNYTVRYPPEEVQLQYANPGSVYGFELIKVNPDGQLEWSHEWADPDLEGKSFFRSLSLTPEGVLVVKADFHGSVDIDPTPAVSVWSVEFPTTTNVHDRSLGVFEIHFDPLGNILSLDASVMKFDDWFTMTKSEPVTGNWLRLNHELDTDTTNAIRAAAKPTHYSIYDITRQF